MTNANKLLRPLLVNEAPHCCCFSRCSEEGGVVLANDKSECEGRGEGVTGGAVHFLFRAIERLPH